MKLSLKISLLIGAIALVIIPAIGFLSFSIAGKVIEERIHNEQGDLARQTLHEIDLRFHKGWENIHLLGKTSLVQEYVEGARKEKLTGLLKEQLVLTGPWDLLMVADTEGKILASTADTPFGNDINSYFPNAEAFYKALTGTPFATDAAISKVSGRPTIALASPIFDAKKERILGVVMGQVSWPVVMEILDGLRPEYNVLLINQKGEVIATRTRDRTAIFHNSLQNDHLFRRTAARKRGTFFETHAHAEEGQHLSSLTIQEGYLKYKGHGWRLLMEVPEVVAFAPVREMARNIGLAVGALLLLLAASVFFVVSRMTRPITHLRQTMAEVGRGHLQLRAKIATQDEVGQLAGAFNQMVEDLARARDEILRAKDYAENIITSMVDTLVVLNPDATIRTVNQATLDLLCYTEEELIGQPIGRILAEEEEEEEEEEALFKGTRLQTLLEEGAVRDHEVTYRTKYGETIPMSFSGAVMRDTHDAAHGAIVGIVGIAKDMRAVRRFMAEERKQAIELEVAYNALDEKTQRLERFQKVTVEGVLETLPLKAEINALLVKLGQPKKYKAPDKIRERRDRIKD
jgi:PAS domain S-box-containing protein